MGNYQNNIQLSIKIDPQNKAEQDLQAIIAKLNKNEISLNIGNNAKETLSSLSQSFDTLYNKSKKSISLDNLTKSAEESAKVFENLANQMGNLNEKSQVKSKQIDRSQELAQARAINKALEDNYKASLKEAEAQKQVQQEIQKQIKLLEIKKQSILAKDNKIDTSYIDDAISKLKSMDNVNMKDLKSEISNINLEIKSVSEEAKNSENSLGKLGNSLKNIGIYFDAGDIFRGLINGAKEAVSYVTTIENSMVSLKRVVDDVSESEFKTLQNEIHDMAVATASSTADMVETVTDWKKLGYDLEQAKSLAESSVKFDIAGDVNNIKTTTTDLISIIRGFGIENDKAVEKAKAIGDAINQLSNNYAVTSQDLADAMKRSSSALNLAGNSINESLSLTTVAQQVNQSAEKVGTGLSTISMRLRGISQDGEELDAKLGELVKNATGVDMTMNGAFRSTYDILHDIAKVWNDGSLNDLTKANLAEQLFGKNQAKVGIAILENFKQLDSTMLSLKDSANSVEEEFARSMDSTQAKMAQLKENIGGIFAQFVNSDMTKGVVDGLNTFVVASGKVIKTLGSIPTVITAVVGSLTVLNTKFRESMTSYQPTKIVELTKSLNERSDIHKKETEAINKKITVQRTEIATQNQTGITYVTSRAKLLQYQTQLGYATLAENACAIGAKALGVAFNMALGVGVGLLIQGLMGLVNASDTAKQKNEELLSSIKSLQSESTELSSLKDQYVSLKRELEEGNLTTEENKTKKEELSNIYNQLIQKVPELESALKLETTGYENQAKAIQSVIDLKNEEAGLKAEQYIKNNKITDDSVQTQIKNLASTQKELDKYSQMSLDPKYTDRQRQNYKNYATSLKESMLEVKQSLQETINTQDTLNKLNIDNGVNDKTIANAKEAISNAVLYKGAVENITEAIENNTKAKADNGNTNIGNEEVDIEKEKTKAISQATEEYQKSTQAIAKAQSYLEKINKANAVTPQLAGQISKAYGDMTTDINNVGDTVDFLKGKIKEQQEEQYKALMTMKNDDKDYYQSKVANNQEYENQINDFLTRFTGDSQKAYDVDLSQFTTLNQMKAGVQSTLKSAVDSFMSQFVDINSSGYKVDYNNFTSLISAKKELLRSFLGTMSDVLWDSTSDTFTESAYGGIDLSGKQSTEAYKKYEEKVNKVQTEQGRIQGALKKLDGIYAGGGLDFKGFDGGGVSDFSGTGGDSKGSKGSSSAQKEAEKAQKLSEEIAKMQSEINPDRYYDLNNAIKDIDNELTTNKTLLDALKEGTPEYQQAQLKDIDLYGKKKEALANLNAEQKKEAEEIKNKLSQYSFVFDANGKLINGQERLLEIQKSVNAMGGSTDADKDKKKEYIDWVKNLSDEIQKFGKLTEDTIPKTANEFDELANSIKKVREEMAKTNKETLGKFRDEMAGYILEDLKKELEKAKDDLKKAEDDDIKNLEEEKQSMINSYDKKIQSLRNELDALNDDSEDKQKKLAKLKVQLNLWKNDNSAFSAKKQDELTNQISDLEKDIKKDNLNAQINDLQKQKDEENKSYEDRMDELKSYYEKQKKAQEDSNDSKLLEEKAYNKADKILKEKNQQEILSLLEGHSTDYKNVGTLLGENFKDGWIEQIEQAKKAYDDLMGDLGSSGSNSSGGSSSNSSSGSGNVKTGDHAWIADGSTTEFYSDPSHNHSKGTAYSNKVSNADELNIEEYDNGFMRVSDSSGKDLGWVERTALNKWNDVKKFADGGRTPSNIDSGALAILHSNENVLNAHDTNMLDDIYKYVKDSGSLLSQLNTTYMNHSSYMTPILPNPLNGLSNGVTNNNNTSNTDTQSINLNFGDIVNNNLADKAMNQNDIAKVVRKVIKDDGSKYGGRR